LLARTARDDTRGQSNRGSRHRRSSMALHTAKTTLRPSATHDTDIATPISPTCTCQPCTIRMRCAIATSAKMIAEIAMYDFMCVLLPERKRRASVLGPKVLRRRPCARKSARVVLLPIILRRPEPAPRRIHNAHLDRRHFCAICGALTLHLASAIVAGICGAVPPGPGAPIARFAQRAGKTHRGGFTQRRSHVQRPSCGNHTAILLSWVL